MLSHELRHYVRSEIERMSARYHRPSKRAIYQRIYASTDYYWLMDSVGLSPDQLRAPGVFKQDVYEAADEVLNHANGWVVLRRGRGALYVHKDYPEAALELRMGFRELVKDKKHNLKSRMVVASYVEEAATREGVQAVPIYSADGDIYDYEFIEARAA